jgi:GntR family transcriptional regulator / MocR family aminotransferase
VHEGAVPSALMSMDGGDRVLLIGTFEGVMFPALRIAYLVVPAHLSQVFTAMRGMLGEHTQVASQQALAEFIDEGHMSTHLRTLRQRCGARREALHEAVARYVPDWARLGPTSEGMHACLHLPGDVPDAEAFTRIRGQGVGTVPVSSICWHAKGVNGLALGYGGSDEATIERAVSVIGGVLSEMH